MGRRFNNPSESVFFPALLYRIIFFIPRTRNNVRHARERAQLVAWRRKNVDRPYKRSLKNARKK
ncbi:hypothetical protein ACFVAJ_16745 [Agromyces sp. NPDC057679]|uniref:hypothetical protein n=1 Tax=Agromyces sp. NPDC057679 TaxID=3346207 RepID=UPI003672C9DC